MMVFSVDQDTIMFATLFPLIEFIIPKKFNGMVKRKTSLFLMLPKVLHELLQVSIGSQLYFYFLLLVH